MKILQAKNKLEFSDLPDMKIDIVELDKIMLTADAKWLRKRYQPFEDSCNRVGMLFPITYTDFDHYWEPQKEKRWPRDEDGEYIKDTLVVHNGNKRVFYAKKYGYTHIEGYFCDCKNTKDIIVRKTFMGKDMFP